MATRARLEQHHVALNCLRHKRNWERFRRFISDVWFPASAQKILIAIRTFHERHPALKQASFNAIEAILTETRTRVDLGPLRKMARTEVEVSEVSFVRFIKEHLCGDAIAVHQSTDDPMKGVPELINKLERIEKITSDTKAGYDYLRTNPMDRMSVSSPTTRIPTPIPGLTRLYRGGISAPDLVTVMGVTDAGKTLLSCAWGAVTIKHAKRVLHITTETHPQAVASRYDCALLGAGVQWIRRYPDVLARYHERLQSRGAALVIQDFTGTEATLADMTKSIDSFISLYGQVDLLLVDRADLLSTNPGKRDYGAFARLWQGMRRTCIEYYIPIIATTQINREGSAAAGSDTKKLHVAESWAKVCDADEVISLGASDEEIRRQQVTLKILKTKKVGGYGRDIVCRVDRARCALVEATPWARRLPATT